VESFRQLLMPQTLGDLLSTIFAIGIVPAGIAWTFFRFLGQKWLENKFAAQLDEQKHEHAKELQELKRKLDAQLSRINKLQEREFEVLRDAWDLLQDAQGHVSSLLSIMRSYSDLSKLSPERFEEFLAGSRLSAVHRQEVADAANRTEHYRDLIFWYDLHDAKQAYWKYRALITKNSIFLQPEVGDLFEKIASVLWDGLVSREVGEESKDIKFWVEASRDMRNKLQPLMEKVREAVRKSLRQSESAVEL
jgi:hypothetical protein